MSYDFTFAHSPEGFDNHIDSSIRGYSNLLDDVVSFSRYFVEDNTNVVDVGCSTGKLTQMILENNTSRKHANYVGIELSESFYNELNDRLFKIRENNQWATIEWIRGDVRNYEFKNCSLVTSLFTLQFMPKIHRRQIIQNIHDGLSDGGAFIFAEKLMCESAFFQELLTFNHYDYKRKTFSPEQIMDKEVKLRDMLKPNTWSELNTMVKDAGFKNTQIFWRNHQFVGVIATK